MNDISPDLRQWIGRSESVHDSLAPEQAQRAAALFDIDVATVSAGSALPPLWHWFYFPPLAPQSLLDTDGHPQRGGFLPPVPLPRRMFAGSRLQFLHPVVLGRAATRTGEIRNVTIKTGRSGALAFVTVGYRVMQDGITCIEEEQDIVYREAADRVAAPEVRAPPDTAPGSWQRTITPDARQLFRFSALTFNAHRIHYDRPYAEQDEGYPGLVVHGPLTAMLLADLVRRNTSAALTSFAFRGLAPLFDLAPFHLRGQVDGGFVVLEALGPDLASTLTASCTLVES